MLPSAFCEMEGIAAAPEPQGQPCQWQGSAVSSQGDAWWWWSLPEAGTACKDTALSLRFSGGQTSTGHSDFPARDAQTLLLSTGSFTFSFFPSRLEGKDASVQAAAGCRGQQHLKAGPASPRLVYLLQPSRHRQGIALLKK